MDLVEKLAAELDRFQQQVFGTGKRLTIVVRYASEMNDPGQPQGRDPANFKSTFAIVHAAFRSRASGVLIAFSAALQADLPEDRIQQFWPGDDNVDIISGTWYIGSPEQRLTSHANMKTYLTSRAGLGKGFGLDEIGGCDAAGTDNDATLRGILNDVEALQLQNVTLKYATLFVAQRGASSFDFRATRKSAIGRRSIAASTSWVRTIVAPLNVSTSHLVTGGFRKLAGLFQLLLASQLVRDLAVNIAQFSLLLFMRIAPTVDRQLRSTALC